MANQFVNLLRGLADSTSKGKAKWKPAASRADAFVLLLSDNSVVIRKSGADYIVELYDANGKLIDATNDTALRPDLNDAYSLMRSVWGAAKRNALGTDDVIQNVLRELD